MSGRSPTDDERDSFAIGASGGDEVVVPWPLIRRLRRRATSVLVRSRAEPPFGGPRHRWWVLWTVLAGLFSVNVTFTIFAVALTDVAHAFRVSLADITWVITAPLLCFGVAAPVLGKVGDVWGHRRLYLVGTAVAVVSTLATAAAPSVGSLIAVRAVSGVDGAAAGAASMALIFRVFEHDDRVKAMGWWSLVGAGGPVIGVVVGGVLIQALGWRVLFLAQAPVILLALLAAMAVLPETERSAGEKFDWWGAATLTVAVSALLWGLNRGPVLGWSSPEVLAGFLVAPAGLAAFVAAERVAPAPLLPLAFLRRRNFSFPMGNQLFSNFAYMGGFILAPALLERVFGYSVAGAGVMVIARPLAFSLTAPLAGYMAGRIGDRVSATSGSVVLFGSMLVFSAVGRGSASAWVLAALALSGVGLGLSSPSTAAAVANSVDETNLGVASAAQQLVAQVGVVAGIQVMQTVQAARQPTAGLVGSFHDAYVVGAMVCVLAALCGTRMTGRRRYPVGSGAPVAEQRAALAEA